MVKGSVAVLRRSKVGLQAVNFTGGRVVESPSSVKSWVKTCGTLGADVAIQPTLDNSRYRLFAFDLGTSSSKMISLAYLSRAEGPCSLVGSFLQTA